MITEHKPHISPTFEEIAGAVARGWCAPETEAKEMDADLAYAITREVETLLASHDDKGFSEEKCLRCGWVMGMAPLNCQNDDTPHRFPSQQSLEEQLEAAQTPAWDRLAAQENKRLQEQLGATQAIVEAARQLPEFFDAGGRTHSFIPLLDVLDAAASIPAKELHDA